jgi:hypothetical protein
LISAMRLVSLASRTTATEAVGCPVETGSPVSGP